MLLFLNPKGVLWTFISANVLTTIVQISGAALTGKATSNQNDPSKYNHVLLAGLVTQMAFNFLFLIAFSYFVALIQRTILLKTDFWPHVKVFCVSLGDIAQNATSVLQILKSARRAATASYNEARDRVVTSKEAVQDVRESLATIQKLLTVMRDGCTAVWRAEVAKAQKGVEKCKELEIKKF